MKQVARFAACAVGLFGTIGFAARAAGAIPLTFGISATNTSAADAPAESVTFDVSGTSVVVNLTDTDADGPAKAEKLTAVFSSGKTVLPSAANEPVYEGNHEAANCDAISGWVWNPQQPDTPIAVSIYADDTLLATVTADQFRRDLQDAHVGAGRHAFTSRPPAELKDGKPHQIRVMAAGSDYDLADSPRVITCAPVPSSSPSGR